MRLKSFSTRLNFGPRPHGAKALRPTLSGCWGCASTPHLLWSCLTRGHSPVTSRHSSSMEEVMMRRKYALFRCSIIRRRNFENVCCLTNAPLFFFPPTDDLKANERLVIKFCSDVTNGLNYLHEMNCILSDLSARCCQIDANMTVKVRTRHFATNHFTFKPFEENSEAQK